MTPNFINSSTNPFGVGSNEDRHQHHQFFVTHHQPVSSSSYSCHFHFNSTQDQAGYYLNELYQSQKKLEGKEYVEYGGSYESENKVVDGLNLSQDHRVGKHEDQTQAKWMSSKMRLKQKMKSSDNNKQGTLKIREDHQKQTSSSMETDYSSNSSSNTPVRVCSDCNTTKTPLWRSGPKGPKSLCNACGIRQRKARRAMAAAAAAAAAENDTPLTTTETPTMKIKVHHKEKTKNNNALTVPFKKRCKLTAGSSSQEPKKLGFEDHLVNLSKKLAFHHVFPQDETEAAILLMAISCGLVHG